MAATVLPDGLALSRQILASDPSSSLSLSTYNVLMPNSVDGWWIYKYYQPEVPEEERAWPKRQALLKSKLLGPDGCSGSDAICIQEACADSFGEDFGFMADAGYAHLLHTKFRLRVATFWKTDRVELADEGSHKSLDRTLCAALRLKGRASPIYVANMHLTGGPNADKRLRQVWSAPLIPTRARTVIPLRAPPTPTLVKTMQHVLEHAS
ncbi:hypothetical protein T484DRAFT_2281021 [Baffinella frigidus]|nr:hypothetical protein T484DRAFT_2281021 [Cryptophyta sp. CCMP2293]